MVTAGFGLGALNDADDDDLDVYDAGDAGSSRRRMAFQEDEDEDMITLGPSTKSSLKRTDERNHSSTVSSADLLRQFCFYEAYAKYRVLFKVSTMVDRCHPALLSLQNRRLRILGAPPF